MFLHLSDAYAAMVYIIWRLHVDDSPNLVQNLVGTVTFFTTTPLYARFMTSLVNHAPQHHLEIPNIDPRVGRLEDNDRICQSVPTA
jgi:hypothetical protein